MDLFPGTMSSGHCPPCPWVGEVVWLRGREKDRTEMQERGKKENCWGYVRKRTNCWGYVKKKSLSKAGTLCHRACGSNKKAQVRSVPCGGPTTSVKREPSETLRNKWTIWIGGNTCDVNYMKCSGKHLKLVIFPFQPEWWTLVRVFDSEVNPCPD